jgi:hypothetical protein
MTTLVIESPELTPIIKQPTHEPVDEKDDDLANNPEQHDEGEENNKKDIGLNVKIELINVKQTLDGKIDTGAAICSLGAIDIKTHGDTVTFTLNDHTYKMNCSTTTITTADGGMESRPVVKFNCKINDIGYDDIEFNLNDRSHLDDKVLIGLNLIKKINGKIDPHDTSSDI